MRRGNSPQRAATVISLPDASHFNARRRSFEGVCRPVRRSPFPTACGGPCCSRLLPWPRATPFEAGLTFAISAPGFHHDCYDRLRLGRQTRWQHAARLRPAFGPQVTDSPLVLAGPDQGLRHRVKNRLYPKMSDWKSGSRHLEGPVWGQLSSVREVPVISSSLSPSIRRYQSVSPLRF